MQNKYEEAAAALDSADRYFGHNLYQRAFVRNMMGLNDQFLSDFENATLCLVQSIDFATESGNNDALWRALFNQGVMLGGKHFDDRDAGLEVLRLLETEDTGLKLATKAYGMNKLFLNHNLRHEIKPVSDDSTHHYSNVWASAMPFSREYKIGGADEFCYYGRQHDLYPLFLTHWITADETYYGEDYGVIKNYARQQQRNDYLALRNAMAEKEKQKQHKAWVFCVVSMAALLLIMGAMLCFWKRKPKAETPTAEAEAEKETEAEIGEERPQVPENDPFVGREIVAQLRLILTAVRTEKRSADPRKEWTPLVRQVMNGKETAFEAAASVIESAYPGLQAKIAELYPDLNETDSKVCLLSCSDLTNAEMGELLGLTVYSVNKSRSELRKKLGFEPGELKAKKSIISTLALLFLLSTAVVAQTHTLSGTVCDENGTLPYATVMVWQGNDTLKATYGITDKKGDFALRGLKDGPYNGMVKFTGLAQLPFAVNLDKDVCLDTLRLTPDVTMLNEVQVTASKVFEDKFDKLRMDITELKLPPSATYIDALREIPGSFYSVSDNTLKILNKAVLVLLNGRPIRMSFDQLTNMLQGEKADDIAEVEIMYETPPRFAGEWDGPVVNILTKKNLATGFYGTVSGDLQLRKRLGERASLNLNFRTLKTNTYLYLSQDYNPREYAYRYWQYREGGDTLMRREANHYNDINRYYIGTGTGIQMDDNNSLDINFSGSLDFDHDNNDEHILNRETAIHSTDTAQNDSRSFWGDVYYKHNFNNPQHYFTVDANLSRNLNESGNLREYVYLPDSLAYNRDASPFSAWLFSSCADYYREGDKFQVQSGLLFRYSDLQNDFSYENLIDGTWQPDTLVSNKFNYTESNYVAYFTFGHQVSEKFSYSATLNDTYVRTLGVSETTGITTPYNYNIVRPYLTLRYKPHDDHYFTFTFGRNYGKPNFTYLNPFRKYESPVYYVEGNPDLKHSITYNLNFNYRFRYWLNFGVSYANATNTVLQVPQLDADGAIIGYKYDNFGKSDDLKLTLNLSKRFFNKRLNLGFFGQARYMLYNSGDALDYRNSLWSYYGNLDFLYVLIKKYNVELGGYALYSSSHLSGYAVTEAIPKMLAPFGKVPRRQPANHVQRE